MRVNKMNKPLNLNGTGYTVVDREVIRRIVQLNDYIIQHNYCIKELTEMVMQLDKRVKFDNERIREVESEVWELQKLTETLEDS